MVSQAESAIALIIPFLDAGFKNRLSLYGPYRDEGGLPGEIYGVLDLDEVGEDRNLPQLSGPASMRQAFTATGPLAVTTFIADRPEGNEDARTVARDLFLSLHARIIEQVPLIGLDMPAHASPCIIRRVAVEGDRLSRVLYQHRSGGAGSNWTMHLVGQVEVSYIIRRDVSSQLHQFT
jgi:hypothetical protein